MLSTMKDHLYTFQYRLFEDFSQLFSCEIDVLKLYDGLAVLGIMSLAKETLFGYLLYMRYLLFLEDAHQKDYARNILTEIYVADVLHIHPDLQDTTIKLLGSLSRRYGGLLDLWIKLDDNQEYMYIAATNRASRISERKKDQLYTDVCMEDINRRQGTLKNITYYNRRYLFPVI